MSELGAHVVDAPRWPDGRLADHEEEVADLLRANLDAGVALVAPWRHDPYPDHAAAGRAAARACAATGAELVEYPVWAPYWMVPDEVRATGYRLRTVPTATEALVHQQRALQRYSSQLEALFPGWQPIVPDDLVSRHEQQLVADPRP